MNSAELLYQPLYLIREVELEIARRYPSDAIKSPIHLSIGQEFVSVAFCSSLAITDYVAATYRGHAAYLAKGGNVKQLIAELYGKATGCAKGRGGSMHLIESTVNFIGTSAVVATGIPVATGYAFSQKYQQNEAIVICFLGDGATEEGAFYESLNFAGLHQLPIIYVVENNQFAIHQPVHKRWANHDLLTRCQGFGVQCYRHEEQNILTLANQAKTIIQQVREGQGPALIEVNCERWYEHVGPNFDLNAAYREQPKQKSIDALEQLKAILSTTFLKHTHQQTAQIIEEAFQFAENSPVPSPEELYAYVYR